MSFTHFSYNGQILPVERATISLYNIEYSYGFGVYETLKVRNGSVYFIDQHLERLQHSANIIGLEHPFKNQEIKKNIQALIKNEENLTACNIKSSSSEQRSLKKHKYIFSYQHHFSQIENYTLREQKQ